MLPAASLLEVDSGVLQRTALTFHQAMLQWTLWSALQLLARLACWQLPIDARRRKLSRPVGNASLAINVAGHLAGACRSGRSGVCTVVKPPFAATVAGLGARHPGDPACAPQAFVTSVTKANLAS
jgi:hypothetical protein